MKDYSRALLGGAVAITAMAAFNALERARAKPPVPVLAGLQRCYAWREGVVRYCVCGEGPPALLLHSINAAGCTYEWRRNFSQIGRAHV